MNKKIWAVALVCGAILGTGITAWSASRADWRTVGGPPVMVEPGRMWEYIGTVEYGPASKPAVASQPAMVDCGVTISCAGGRVTATGICPLPACTAIVAIYRSCDSGHTWDLADFHEGPGAATIEIAGQVGCCYYAELWCGGTDCFCANTPSNQCCI